MLFDDELTAKSRARAAARRAHAQWFETEVKPLLDKWSADYFQPHAEQPNWLNGAGLDGKPPLLNRSCRTVRPSLCTSQIKGNR